MAILAPDHIPRQRRQATSTPPPVSVVHSGPSTTTAIPSVSQSSAFDALTGASDPAASAKAAITSPGTIKIVVLLVVTTIVLFSIILVVLCCYRDGDRRSRFCGCFGSKRPRSLPPRLPPKDGYGHDDTQPLTPRAERLRMGNLATRDTSGHEGRSWTDRVRHSAWMDRPRRSHISPPRSPVMMTSVGLVPAPRNNIHPAPTRHSDPHRMPLPPPPRIQPRSPNTFRSPIRRDFGQGPPTPPKPTQSRMLAPPIVTRKQAPSLGQQQSNGPTFDQILRPPSVVREPQSFKRQTPLKKQGTPLRFADDGYAAGRVD